MGSEATGEAKGQQSTTLGNRALRLLLVVNTLPPHDLSGAGEQAVQLAAGLRAKGVRTEILGRGRGGAKGPKMLFPLTIIWPVLRRLRDAGIDVVQIHESDGGFLALVLRMLRLPIVGKLFPSPRLVALLQVSYDEEARQVRTLIDSSLGVLAEPVRSEVRFRRYRTPVQRVLGRCTARCADVVLVPSSKTGDEIARDYGGPRPRVLPNATAPVRVGASLRSVVNGHLLFVGRLRIRKGVEVLLWALASLRDQGYEYHLSIAGDGERRQVLENLVVKLRLSTQVTFLGKCTREQIDRCLQGAVALVVPSTYEGMPLVILEAMEAEVPVIASAVSGIPEVVVDGSTGWLVPPRDVEALADILIFALSDLEECERRGKAGKERLALYRPEVIAAAWLDAVLHGSA